MHHTNKKNSMIDITWCATINIVKNSWFVIHEDLAGGHSNHNWTFKKPISEIITKSKVWLGSGLNFILYFMRIQRRRNSLPHEMEYEIFPVRDVLALTFFGKDVLKISFSQSITNVIPRVDTTHSCDNIWKLGLVTKTCCLNSCVGVVRCFDNSISFDKVWRW